MKTPLELVREMEPASPCPVAWADMHGDDRVRHCSQCDKQVYNLSAMTAKEAVDFWYQTQGRACVHLLKRADGTVLTQDCPVGLRQKLRRRWRRLTALAASVFAFVLTLGCDSGNRGERDQGHMLAPPPTTAKEKHIPWVGKPVPPPHPSPDV